MKKSILWILGVLILFFGGANLHYRIAKKIYINKQDYLAECFVECQEEIFCEMKREVPVIKKIKLVNIQGTRTSFGDVGWTRHTSKFYTTIHLGIYCDDSYDELNIKNYGNPENIVYEIRRPDWNLDSSDENDAIIIEKRKKSPVSAQFRRNAGTTRVGFGKNLESNTYIEIDYIETNNYIYYSTGSQFAYQVNKNPREDQKLILVR